MALAEVGRNGSLPFPDKSESDEMETDKNPKVTKESLVKTLLGLIKNGKANMKVRERSAVAAGHLCVGDSHFKSGRDVMIKHNSVTSRISKIPH